MGAGSGPSVCWCVQTSWVPAIGQAQDHGFGQTPRLALTLLGLSCLCTSSPASAPKVLQ